VIRSRIANRNRLDCTDFVFARKIVDLEKQYLECDSNLAIQAKLLRSFQEHLQSLQTALTTDSGHVVALMLVETVDRLSELHAAVVPLVNTKTQLTQETELTMRQMAFLYRGRDHRFKSALETLGLQTS
jgi:hypothetical protein